MNIILEIVLLGYVLPAILMWLVTRLLVWSNNFDDVFPDATSAVITCILPIINLSSVIILIMYVLDRIWHILHATIEKNSKLQNILNKLFGLH